MRLWLWFLTTLVAGGHGIIHEDIARVTAELRKEPGNSRLLFVRAALYRAHGEVDNAFVDLNKIAGQTSPSPAVFLELADLSLEKESLLFVSLPMDVVEAPLPLLPLFTEDNLMLIPDLDA